MTYKVGDKFRNRDTGLICTIDSISDGCYAFRWIDCNGKVAHTYVSIKMLKTFINWKKLEPLFEGLDDNLFEIE